MKNIFKNKENGPVSAAQGGFLKLILLIVVAIFLMKYFQITVGGIIAWLKSVF